MSAKFILQNSLLNLYVVTDLDGNIVSQNEHFENSVSHIKPKNFIDVVSDESDHPEVLSSINKAKEKFPEPKSFHAKTKQKNGAQRWHIWEVFCMLGKLHFCGHDILDVVSVVSYEYERQKQLLEEIRFVQEHELGQPLMSLVGINNILETHSKEKDDSELESLIAMQKESASKLNDVMVKIRKMANRQI
jgi:light-regulated signal transduction histidine kinase (bacteriophytochrome)